MLRGRSLVVAVLLLSCLVAAAKDKKKFLLPIDVLQARTVLVVVDPDAGTDIQNPNANRAAREDVEKALMKWGRFSIALEAANADLIVTVRRGNGKVARATIGGIPTNNRPVVMQPTDSGVRIGGRSGNSSTQGDPSNSEPSAPRPQVEMGPSQDMFAVYRGNREYPLESPAVWSYSAKDALQAPGVPAVEEFRKLVVESEKLQSGKP